MELKHHEAVLSRRDCFIINPRALKVDTSYNVRNLDTPDAREHIDDLKASIAVNSVRVPLEVRMSGSDLYVVSGHCRLAAVMELIAEGRDDIKGIPCIKEPNGTNDAERVLNLAISNSGKPLSTLEVAEVVHRLQGFGWTEEEIQKRMRWKSRASVAHHMEVAALPEAVKQHVRDDDISASLAVKMMRDEPEKVAELIEANKAENKRLGVGARMKNRVTPKSIARAQKAKTTAKLVEEHRDSPPSSPQGAVPAQDDTQAKVGPAPASKELVEAFNRWEPPMRASPSIGKLIEALEPFAKLANQYDFNEKSDDDLAEVPFRDLKRAWVAFATATGEAEAA